MGTLSPLRKVPLPEERIRDIEMDSMKIGACVSFALPLPNNKVKEGE